MSADSITLTSADDESFQYLFDQPSKPLAIPKGDKNFLFELPPKTIADRIPNSAVVLHGINGETTNRISIEPITKYPDLTVPMMLGREDNFSLFIPFHSEIASALIKIFMDTPTRKEFLAVAADSRDKLNPYLFNYALSVALLHRSDTRNIPIPSLAEIFPEKYVCKSVLNRSREESLAIPAGSRVPLQIPLDYTASDLDIEHRVAYFREDTGINLHHWHWHLIYPFDAPKNIVNKDRRGELFYYMHRQIVARYDFERLCNNLQRVKRLQNLREPVAEGYFPKLDNLASSRVWPSRPDNTVLKDIKRDVDQIRVDLEDLERWKDRVLQAVHTGRVETAEGEKVLTVATGIDVLGNILESSILSVNPNLYGNLHNLGHIVIGCAHDPDHRHLESFTVLGDSATAMRDPVFYRWHATVDDIFQKHKDTLPRYEVNELDYPDVKVRSIEVTIPGQPVNVLATFWQKSNLDLSRGLDFTNRGSVYAQFTHLQHAPFTYKITVENSGQKRKGTVRIFLAPINDERGVPFLFKDQRLLFIELDKFEVDLEPNTNTIDRSSEDSSVTIPFQQIYRNLDAKKPSQSMEEFNFCGCGWPHNMLIPRGTGEGYPCKLFVMISNYEDDRVDDGGTARTECKPAASYCGIRDKKYPDRRSMGYPFDRQPRDGIYMLKQFLTPNMAVQDVNIAFTDEIF